jgi:hypothetical protein
MADNSSQSSQAPVEAASQPIPGAAAGSGSSTAAASASSLDDLVALLVRQINDTNWAASQPTTGVNIFELAAQQDLSQGGAVAAGSGIGAGAAGSTATQAATALAPAAPGADASVDATGQ